VADVSVRPARADDVPEIVRVQLDTWRTAYARLLPPAVLAGVSPAQAGARWTAAVTAPPSPRHRVLVAIEGQAVVGFAAFGPADDDAAPETPAATIHALLVEPRWGRRGHGSRLLAATVDHLRADGVRHAVVWVIEGDAASASFYRSAGWEPDGYVRALADDGPAVREERFHVSLADDPVAG
jgi:GNAT superfamily N-acetyltransferase